jgi:AcrR family transcriptional regulator
MKSPRIDVGSIRREQIVEAAVAVVAEQGIQNLSLSEIEQKAGMSRGQLTYYFPAKEDILLAVFDRTLQRMRERAHTGGFENCPGPGGGWDRVRFLVSHILLSAPPNPTFGALQHTFLAQMSHRDDFRQRLANLYEEWRGHIARDFADELARRPDAPAASPRALATLVQAVMHGLFVQRTTDPGAFDQREVVGLLLDVIESYLRPASRRAAEATPGRRTSKNGAVSDPVRPRVKKPAARPKPNGPPQV